MKKIYFLTTLILIFGISCNDDSNTNVDNNVDTSNIVKGTQIIKIKDKVFSIPSPLQVSMLVNEKNISFNPQLLNDISNASKYLTSFKQALNIGVYGADLGNLFVYDQLSQSAEYLAVIKNLSDQIGIMNSINEATMNRMEQNNSNRDSLLYIISDVYLQIDSYLLENDQEELGVLIITGGWIESLYFLTKIVEIDSDPEIISRIGEQQRPLNNIIELLQPNYEQKNEDVSELIEYLVELSIIFDAIEVVYAYEEPDVDAKNKTTTINSTTTYNITNEELVIISEKINNLRNWVISE